MQKCASERINSEIIYKQDLIKSWFLFYRFNKAKAKSFSGWESLFWGSSSPSAGCDVKKRFFRGQMKIIS